MARGLLCAVKLCVLTAAACGGSALTRPEGVIPVSPGTPAIVAAAMWVDICAAKVPVVRPLSTLRFFVVPGDGIQVGEFRYAGYGEKNNVYVAAAYAGYIALWAHEILHATRGLKGVTATDHPAPFYACRLAPGQI